MKVALIFPPVWPVFFPPLGIAYIASVLRRGGHTVEIFDHNIECWNQFRNNIDNFWTEENIPKADGYDYMMKKVIPALRSNLNFLLKQIVAQGFDAIGISCFRTNFYFSRHLACYIRKMIPQTKIFYGGPSIYLENHFLQNDLKNRIVDAAIVGEGEESVVSLMDRWERGLSANSVSGVLSFCQQSEKIVFEKRRPLTIDKLPLPDFKGFNFDLYKERQLPIMMSRGCVAACHFCDEVAFWKKYRRRSVKTIVNELKRNVVDYKITNFYFCDSLINGDHFALDELLSEIEKSELKIKWTAFARVDSKLTKNILGRMARSGCQILLFGFESGSQKMLNLMNKGTTVKEAYRVVKDAYDVGIEIHGLFIVGHPFETNRDLRKTFEFIFYNRSRLFVAVIGNTLEIAPFSAIRRNPKKLNILTDNQNNIVYDKDDDWLSKRKQDNPNNRRKRLRLLQLLLEFIDIHWVPKPRGMSSRLLRSGIFAHMYLRLILFQIKVKQLFKLKYSSTN